MIDLKIVIKDRKTLPFFFCKCFAHSPYLKKAGFGIFGGLDHFIFFIGYISVEDTPVLFFDAFHINAYRIGIFSIGYKAPGMREIKE